MDFTFSRDSPFVVTCHYRITFIWWESARQNTLWSKYWIKIHICCFSNYSDKITDLMEHTQTNKQKVQREQDTSDWHHLMTCEISKAVLGVELDPTAISATFSINISVYVTINAWIRCVSRLIYKTLKHK